MNQNGAIQKGSTARTRRRHIEYHRETRPKYGIPINDNSAAGIFNNATPERRKKIAELQRERQAEITRAYLEAKNATIVPENTTRSAATMDISESTPKLSRRFKTKTLDVNQIRPKTNSNSTDYSFAEQPMRNASDSKRRWNLVNPQYARTKSRISSAPKFSLKELKRQFEYALFGSIAQAQTSRKKIQNQMLNALNNSIGQARSSVGNVAGRARSSASNVVGNVVGQARSSASNIKNKIVGNIKNKVAGAVDSAKNLPQSINQGLGGMVTRELRRRGIFKMEKRKNYIPKRTPRK
jgi:uncharacterized protein YjbJ (UPF0337 family)